MASASNAAQIAATASVLPPNQAVVYGIPVSIMDGQAVVNNVPISIASVVLPYPVFSIYEAQFTTEIVQLFTLECAGTQIVQSRSVSVTIPISASVTIDSVPVKLIDPVDEQKTNISGPNYGDIESNCYQWSCRYHI